MASVSLTRSPASGGLCIPPNSLYLAGQTFFFLVRITGEDDLVSFGRQSAKGATDQAGSSVTIARI